MIFRRSALLSLLASATISVVSANSSEATTTSTSSEDLLPSNNRREFFAQPVGDGTNRSSSLMMDSSSKPSKVPFKNQQDDKKPYNDTGMQRFLSQVRATVMNLNVPSLSAEEYMFFEDTLRATYEAVYGLSVNNAIVTSAEQPDLSKMDTKDGGSLRGSHGHGRDLFYHPNRMFWFDILALFEITCTLCVPDTGDDDDDFFNRQLVSSDDDDDDFEDLKKELWQKKLCAALRSGPYESFSDVYGCQVLMN